MAGSDSFPLKSVSAFRGEDPPQVVDDMAGTFDCAHTTAQADALVDDSAVLRHPDRTGGTGFLTDAAANAAGRTLFPGRRALVFVRAFDYNIVGTLMDMNDMLRTNPHTGAAGNTAAYRRLANLKNLCFNPFCLQYFCHFTQCCISTAILVRASVN